MRHLDNCLSLHKEYGNWNNFLRNHCSLLSETEEYADYFLLKDRVYRLIKNTGEVWVMTKTSEGWKIDP